MSKNALARTQAAMALDADGKEEEAYDEYIEALISAALSVKQSRESLSYTHPDQRSPKVKEYTQLLQVAKMCAERAVELLADPVATTAYEERKADVPPPINTSGGQAYTPQAGVAPGISVHTPAGVQASPQASPQPATTPLSPLSPNTSLPPQQQYHQQQQQQQILTPQPHSVHNKIVDLKGVGRTQSEPALAAGQSPGGSSFFTGFPFSGSSSNAASARTNSPRGSTGSNTPTGTGKTIADLTLPQRAVLQMIAIQAAQENMYLDRRLERYKLKGKDTSRISLDTVRRKHENVEIAKRKQQTLLKQMLEGTAPAAANAPIAGDKRRYLQSMRRISRSYSNRVSPAASPSNGTLPLESSQETGASSPRSLTPNNNNATNTTTTTPDANEVQANDEAWMAAVAESPDDCDLIHNHLAEVYRTPTHKCGHFMHQFVNNAVASAGVVSDPETLAQFVTSVMGFFDAAVGSLLQCYPVLNTTEGQEQARLSTEDAFFYMAYPSLFPLYANMSQSRDTAFQHKAAFLRTQHPSVFDIRQRFWLVSDAVAESGDVAAINTAMDASYSYVVSEFHRLPELRSPFDKLCCMVNALQGIVEAVEEYWEEVGGMDPSRLTMGADDIMPMFAVLLIHANIEGYCATAAFLNDFINETICRMEEGYALATFQTSVNFLEQVYDSVKESDPAPV